MKIKKRPYLDFYGKYRVSPVPKELDTGTHFQQRKHLYQSLGIPSALISGGEILEFGPGNGVNSLYTMSLNPAKYVLVDANPCGLENTRRNFLQAYPAAVNYHVIQSMIEEYEDDSLYDLVICEGLLPNQLDPTKFSQYVARFVKPGGMYIITCHDVISNMSEILRAFLSHFLVKGVPDFSKKVEILVEFFKEDLLCLKNMSRSHEDWVIDNLLNDEYWKDSVLFTVAESIDAHKDKFTFNSASPSFYSDWRWYKDMTGLHTSRNIKAISQYNQLKHNLIHYKLDETILDETQNVRLSHICCDIKRKIQLYMTDLSQQSFCSVVSSLETMADHMELISVEVHGALCAYIETITSAEAGKIRVSSMYDDLFRTWWGRGMQYVSFIKDIEQPSIM